jgi:hypothetical protein
VVLNKRSSHLRELASFRTHPLELRHQFAKTTMLLRPPSTPHSSASVVHPAKQRSRRKKEARKWN